MKPDEPLDQRRRGGKMGGHVGGLIGCCGWWISFVVICLAAGAIEPLLEVAWPGLVLSLGTGVMSIVAAELVERAWGRQHRMFQTCLWGFLLFSAGMLVFVLTVWIEPIIERSPKLMNMLQSLGSTFTPGTFLPSMLMTIGLVLLVRVAVNLIRNRPSEADREAARATEIADAKD
ncbi:MAG: hypothetical protein IIC50_24610 [Planctomycetes bacterium]|nr:hypothetical protein [Planctomycetota bacterium]